MPKNFVGEPSSVSLISGIERFYASESYVTILCRNFFCLRVPKNFVEEPFWSVFQKMSGSKKVYGKEGGGGVSSFSVEFFLSHSAENFLGEPSSVSLISGVGKG